LGLAFTITAKTLSISGDLPMSKKKKVYVTVKTRLIMEVNEDYTDPVGDIISQMDYRFLYKGDEGEIVDHEIFEQDEEVR
jgi:hypothetical protein